MATELSSCVLMSSQLSCACFGRPHGSSFNMRIRPIAKKLLVFVLHAHGLICEGPSNILEDKAVTAGASKYP